MSVSIDRGTEAFCCWELLSGMSLTFKYLWRPKVTLELSL